MASRPQNKFHFDDWRGLSHKPTTFYLAYGSNLSQERLAARCPDAVPVGTTKIQGYRLLFKKSGSGFYATIEQDANCFVPAAVYKISEYDEALLNRFEGYPKYYYKRRFMLPVRTLAGGRLRGLKQCMAYVLHEERLLGEPSMDYYRILDIGYETWGFDVEILDRGLSDSIGVKPAREYIEQFQKL